VTGYRPHPLAHLQVGFERGDDFFSDPLEDCPKQGDQSGLPFGQGGIVEGYGDGNFALHLHFRVWPGSLQSHPDEFCAVHRAVRKPFFVREASRVLDDDESKSTRLKLSCLPRDSCIEYPVLVATVPLLRTPCVTFASSRTPDSRGFPDRRRRAAQGWNAQTDYWNRKASVFGAVERSGRIRAEVVPNSRGPILDAKVREFILPGSMIFTDEWKGYERLGKTGYTHRRIKHHARV
jgi:hypothetical protein